MSVKNNITELYKPSLTADWKPKLPFDRYWLCWYALVLGLLPTFVLNTKNALLLGADKRKLVKLIILGVLAMIIQLVGLYFVLTDKSNINFGSAIILYSRTSSLWFWKRFDVLTQGPYFLFSQRGTKAGLFIAIALYILGIVGEGVIIHCFEVLL